MARELDELIESRAHRILRHLSRYRVINDGASSIPSYLNEYSFSENEKPIGVYENVPNSRVDSIVITTLGVHVFLSDIWRFTGYEEIDRIDAPQPKRTVNTLVANLRSGTAIEIPVNGGQGKLRDAWEFLRFLMRVTEVTHKQTGKVKVE